MKKNILLSVIIVNFVFIIIFSLFSSVSSQTISVDDYIKDKFPSIFGFHLSSLEDLDSYEKEFLDLLQKLPEEEQEYYAKEVYKNGFSLELLENVKESKTIQLSRSSPVLPSLSKQTEELNESLPSIIKRIAPSTVYVIAYNGKEEFLKLGSGFFISQNGDIITNYQLLQGASSAEIKTSDGKTFPITYIVAEDEQSDIIRLSVDIPSQYAYPLSLSTTIPEVGEEIIVYDGLLGLGKTVSDGIVSAIREVPGYGKLIQITAPISPGSSGSPVLNMSGEVIGVATFQLIEEQNLNFALPSERITSLNLIAEEKIFTTEELYEQEGKEKKDSDYAYEALNKALYFTFIKEEYEKALPYWEIAIEVEPTVAYFAIGNCYEKLGAYTKAVEAYKQAVNLNPDMASGHYNLGFVYDNLGLYEEARESYIKAIRIDPDYAEAHYRLGAEYIIFGFRIFAIEAYKQAIRIDPDYAEAHYSLGIAYLLIRDRDSAINEYKILKNLDIDLANELFDSIY